MIPYLAIEYFSILGFKFYSWGFFIALAFLVGLALSIKVGRKVGISPEKIITLIVLVYFGAIIGARLFFVLQWPGEFLKDPVVIFNITQGGMMFYGGLFGGVLAGWLYIRKLENRWQLISRLNPIIALAMAIGRVGCLLNSDHLGGLTNVPWAMRMPDGFLRHPVALYLILFDLALAGFLWWVLYSHSDPASAGEESPTNVGNAVPHMWEILRSAQDDKKTFLLFLTIYPLVRFLLDFTRDVSADPHFWGLATSQWLSFGIFAVCLLYFLRLKSHKEAPVF
ncbi:MAG: prolipoprotein diacylglyceryl transferase [bacterium]